MSFSPVWRQEVVSVDFDVDLPRDLVLDGSDDRGHGILHDGLVPLAATDRDVGLQKLADTLD